MGQPYLLIGREDQTQWDFLGVIWDEDIHSYQTNGEGIMGVIHKFYLFV